jgi:hypothetical protein
VPAPIATYPVGRVTEEEAVACKLSFSSTTRARSRRESSAVKALNPGTPPAALKSHEFSDRPMKLRIVGSTDQPRRSAARARSAATLAERKGRMSDPALIDPIGGKFAVSKGGWLVERCLSS